MDPFDQSEEELFIEWLELPVNQRKEFLSIHLCPNDPAKRQDVLELIKAFEESEGLFEVTPEEDFSQESLPKCKVLRRPTKVLVTKSVAISWSRK